ncbi:MAG: class I SAM-dependent methyltransferase [Firmicutes bacterium]|jgi:ubiquinone/menaquinone biosynthesis C-methylase UbiE|nr:class I SAM-dependent methyltransferase [Bacillota bacterium]
MGNAREVQRNFGMRAAAYRQSRTHGNRADLERMLKLLAPDRNAVALDVATGGGHTACALAPYVKSVTAIDITPEMLREAAVNAGTLGLNNISFQACDVHNLPFADGQFDLVACRLAAHHFYDIKKALQEMCRVLKKGGKLYILDCSVCDGEEAEREINRMEKIRDSSHYRSYSPRQWLALLGELPLVLGEHRLMQQQYDLPEWFERMGTGPAEQREIFRILQNLSPACRALYPFGEDFIATYRFECVAVKC